MHPRFSVQLPHTSVHPRDSRHALAPLLPPFFVLLPLHEVELYVLRHVHGAMGCNDQHMAIEFSKDDLTDPGVNAYVALVEVRAFVPAFGR